MKKIIVPVLTLLALAPSASAHTHNERPIEDSFLWMTSQARDEPQGTLRRVEVKRVNKLVSPGVFN